MLLISTLTTTIPSQLYTHKWQAGRQAGRGVMFAFNIGEDERTACHCSQEWLSRHSERTNASNATLPLLPSTGVRSGLIPRLPDPGSSCGAMSRNLRVKLLREYVL